MVSLGSGCTRVQGTVPVTSNNLQPEPFIQLYVTSVFIGVPIRFDWRRRTVHTVRVCL